MSSVLRNNSLLFRNLLKENIGILDVIHDMCLYNATNQNQSNDFQFIDEFVDEAIANQPMVQENVPQYYQYNPQRNLVFSPINQPQPYQNNNMTSRQRQEQEEFIYSHPFGYPPSS